MIEGTSAIYPVLTSQLLAYPYFIRIQICRACRFAYHRIHRVLLFMVRREYFDSVTNVVESVIVICSNASHTDPPGSCLTFKFYMYLCLTGGPFVLVLLLYRRRFTASTAANNRARLITKRFAMMDNTRKKIAPLWRAGQMHATESNNELALILNKEKSDYYTRGLKNYRIP